MCIDVSRGGKSAVPEPDLDLFHGDSFAQQQAGTGVAKIVEANFLEVILLY